MATIEHWFTKDRDRLDRDRLDRDSSSNNDSTGDVRDSSDNYSYSESDIDESDARDGVDTIVGKKRSKGQKESLIFSKKRKDSSTHSGTSDTQTTDSGHSKFKTKWLSDYPWLQYDATRKVMLCSTCQRHRKGNAYARGTNNFKHTNILRHIRSSDHKAALQAEGCRSLTVLSSQAQNQKMKAIISAVRNVYWLAKEEIATFKYRSLNELLLLQGCDDISHLSSGKNAQYTSYHIAEEMQEALSNCIQEDLRDLLAKADFIGVLMDESTDIGTLKNLIMYIRTVVDGVIETHFLRLIELDEGATGEAVVSKVRKALEENGVQLQKCVGFASDGARAMTGRVNGAAAILQQECPSMVAVHCVAHRLALASSQAAKAFPELVQYKRTLISIYSYFSHSSKRVHTLQEVQMVLEDPLLRCKPLYDVRWLSFFNAVGAVKRTFKSLIVYFDQEVAEHNDPIAKGLVTQISSYSFLAITHMLYDVLSELTRLSKIFQKESLDFSIIGPSVDATIASISSTPGPVLTEFIEQAETNGVFVEGHTLTVSLSDKQKFKKLQESFVADIVSNLRARFPQTSVLLAMSVLDPQHLPQDSAKLPTYGNSQLDVLIKHFSIQCPTISSECKEEWSSLKQLAAKNYSMLSLQKFWVLICRSHKEQYPHLIKLAHACMAIPITTATCERGFSTQNRIKTKIRNRLKTKSLDILMRLSEEGPPVNEMDYNRPAKIWYEAKERRLFKGKKK